MLLFLLLYYAWSCLFREKWEFSECFLVGKYFECQLVNCSLNVFKTIWDVLFENHRHVSQLCKTRNWMSRGLWQRQLLLLKIFNVFIFTNKSIRYLMFFLVFWNISFLGIVHKWHDVIKGKERKVSKASSLCGSLSKKYWN